MTKAMRLHPMADTSATPPAEYNGDLPPHILRLARAMARDCSAPGDYVLMLHIPEYPREAVTMHTMRTETLREISARRRGDEGEDAG